MSPSTTLAHLIECEHIYGVYFDSCLEEVLDCLNTHYPGFNYLILAKQIAAFAEEHGVVLNNHAITAWVNGSTFNMQWFVSERTGSEFVIERSLVQQGSLRKALHHRLSLPVRLQGQGLVRTILRAFYEQYQQANIDEILLVAGKFWGGYFWAKCGFYATNEQEVRSIVDRGRVLDISHSVIEILSAIVDAFYARNAVGTPFPMRLLANEPTGKLLLKGASWDGVLNLHNLQHVSIFETYLYTSNV